MRFTSETAKQAKQIKQGKARARYWRALGFPNLTRARAKLAELREARRVGYTEAELDAMEVVGELFEVGSPNERITSKPPGSGVGPAQKE
jgi:hypothetical protein